MCSEMGIKTREYGLSYGIVTIEELLPSFVMEGQALKKPHN